MEPTDEFDDSAAPRQFTLQQLALAIAVLAAGMAAWRWAGWLVAFPLCVCYGVMFGAWWSGGVGRVASAMRGGTLGGALGMVIGAIGATGRVFADPSVGLMLLVFPTLLGLVLGAALSLLLTTVLFDRD
jgi:hypothetical protein